MVAQALASPICWAIVLVALFTYQQLFAGYFHLRHQPATPLDHSLSTVCIGAMPLLGLLGTIVGLLACFNDMALGGLSANPLSGGIADALLTTQLGLVCALPGWLLQAHLHSTERQNLQLNDSASTAAA
jgi:biopolymer transport protein ExbB